MLTVSRFCDDVADSDHTDDDVQKIIGEANTLFQSAGLECKGWSRSGEPPHPDVTHDGHSVDLGGMQWMPQTDSVVVKIPPLHFGKKMRGKLTIGTEVFDGSFQDLEKFVPTLTRRIVTSKFAALFDPFGKLVQVLE